SFLYTSTGDNFNQLKYLFGVPVQDIQMKMALTYPPGFTIVFLQHDDRLNIDIAYSPGVINNNELHLFEEKIKELLLA
ncbi:MAG: hypothetical protein ABIO04_05600, partial [Ferruginibacter sp.]